MSEVAMPPVRSGKRALSTRRKLGISRTSVVAATISLLVGVVGAYVSPSGGLVMLCMTELAFIFLLLWQENEPPLLMIPVLYQWISVSTKALMTIFTGEPINTLAEYDIDVVPGVLMGLGAVALLALGMRIGLGKPLRDWNAVLKLEARAVTQASILKVAIGTILLGHLLFYLMRYAGPANQLIYALANIRFAGLFALGYWCFIARSGFGYLAFALVVEILIGLTGFFSDFKAPIFVIGFAALAAGHRPKLRDAVVVGALTAMLVVFGSFWSEIKLDYRTYISGGTMEQVVVVPLDERIDYLTNEIRTFNGERFADGFDKLLRRQSYIDYLASTMKNVPARMPHEHGKRIGKTLLNMAMPRILFPDKPATEFDSEVTAESTGLPIQIRQGTSISIGWVGELYIDFGTIGALLSTLVLGLGLGFAYRQLRRRGQGSILLTYGARVTVLSVLMPFDTALIKYVGGAGVAFVGAYLLQVFAVPKLSKLLRIKRTFRVPEPAAGPAR
jgi:hypothetical protein